MKLWTGRFQKDVGKATNDFNSSIATDQRMFRQDIQGSIAHAAMLGATGILSQADTQNIVDGLNGILDELENGTLAVDPEAEDIHTFVEAALTARIGDAGKRLHTGRSRNDQVATDLRLFLREESDGLQRQIQTFADVLRVKSAEYPDAIMPGYTHLQRAQPILFADHLFAYQEMLSRDIGRLRDATARMNVSPLGSGALAGTGYPINRAQTAALLGFDGFTKSTLDGVSDRDFCVEFAAALSLVMVHLSRFSEEIILWSSWEFKFVELDDAYATGSSIMPQKKNPDLAELIRGKSGRVFGDLMALLTVMKGLPLAYNKDMQEDKDAIFDAFDTVKACLTAATPMIATMQVLPQNMRAAAAKGMINATDCADYLVGKGLPFRDAYKATGALVAMCVAQNKDLETLTLEDYKSVCPLFDQDVFAFITLEACIRRRRNHQEGAVV